MAMLQRFIAVTLIVGITGLLTACDATVQSNPAQPAPATENTLENTLQLKFPTPPSAAMKTELKQEKYQLQQGDREQVRQ